MTDLRLRGPRGPAWGDRAVAVLATVGAAVVAVLGIALGLVVGVAALVVLLPVALFGLWRLRRLLRRAAEEAQRAGAGAQGDTNVIEGEYRVVRRDRGPRAGPDDGP